MYFALQVLLVLGIAACAIFAVALGTGLIQ
jgi:hypothetical protein